MTEYHVAVDTLASPDPNTPELQVETVYLGTVGQSHVDEVRAIAALDDSPQYVKEHPHIAGAFMVLRDDGHLDVYVPTDATEYRVYEPDPLPKTKNQGGDLTEAELVQKKATSSYGGADLPRGATSAPAYIDGAKKFGGQSIGGAMDYPSNPPRVVWHTTESPAGASYFTSVAAYLIRVASEPQVIYCPETDLIGQFGPLNQSARALQNDGKRRTNREGRACIQVEVLGRAASPWTDRFDPAKKPNFRKLLAAGRAHGVPDVWPAGKPKATAAEVAKTTRNRTTWQSKGGHFSHGQVPGQSHWDPGAINTDIVPGKPAVETKPATPAKPTKPAPPAYEPFPGANFFHGGRYSPIVTAMGRRLVAMGCGKYSTGPGPNWTNADKRSYAAWQKKYSKANDLGWTDAECDGIPGKKSWDALRVPNV
ncbi:peptidoglycan-binding protein [Streptomyces sp. NPDC005548]|uniref:peptidoglycan-binding protein n=1 Tax=Streptomyces sp. NPDC005548 TaxID=3364724 RepID=UPI0036B9BD62